MKETVSPPRAVKRRRRPRRIFGLWPRLFALGLFAVILVAFAVALIGKIVRPYNQARVQTQEMRQVLSQIAAARAENARLTHRVAYLKTPDGTATEARRFNYLREGEIPLVISLPVPPVPLAAPPLPAVDQPSLWDRARGFWDRVRGKE